MPYELHNVCGTWILKEVPYNFGPSPEIRYDPMRDLLRKPEKKCEYCHGACEVECWRCSGTGKHFIIFYGDEDCGWCDGTGRVKCSCSK